MSDGSADEPTARSRPDPATIAVRDVSLSFGDLRVLEDVSLTVSPGEFVGLVGPNGAGKTTLLRSISGAFEPSSGTIEIGGTDVHDVSSRASSRFVAVVPQDTSLSFSFPVRDVVEMGRHPHRSRFSSPTVDDRDAVERALERTRTTDLADRPIDEVSGGQRQRVVLARAVAQATPVLLLDEPTASLDINHQIETLELVRELVDDGRTVVAAIHDLDLAARYCDRLVLLADGTVHSDGPPQSVLTRETIAETFEANAAVTPNPVTGTPTVTALSDRTPFAGADSEIGSGRADGGDRFAAFPVHVIGSGTAAAGVLERLERAGVDVSVGPVPAGGVAEEAARRLEVDYLAVEPFEPISSDVRAAVDARIRNADVTVVVGSALPAVGPDDLESLESASSLVVVEPESGGSRTDENGASDRLGGGWGERARKTPMDGLLEAIDAELE
ncbi:heme ABC transporter ATP-binding protein [Natrarchaeobius chitinivorans]|uniref:Cobalamin import ATP-binding protein BtuD n=1 Tax=Natrarchaeobius chitinivorans TaxID=1679083 RepID=A0A3N6MLT1_NATCH|nr:heme ABC transporter ATP-binding protein [Natrarchaeobius chitinivorans]RQG96991.1 heme ABC transporter ATP-binding protein [Natrarchaeobius chitinivorans]